MKRKGNLWNNFISKENISTAFYASIKGKTNRNDVKKVMLTADIHLQEILNMFETDEWVPSQYTQKIIRDNNKERILLIPPFYPDRIIHHMINQILEPIFVPTFIQDTYQCIKGRGVHKAIKKAESNTQSGNWDYVLKVDIKKFYSSIDNEILKKKISRKIKDKKFLKVVFSLIDSTTGVPIGNCTSQLLANIYLSDLDHTMKRISKSYVRYADDFIIFSKTKSECRDILDIVILYVDKNKLSLNTSTQYFNIHKRPLLFLGFRMYPSHTRPKKTMLRKSNANISKERKASLFGWIKNSSCTIYLAKIFWKEINKNRNHFIKHHMRLRLMLYSQKRRTHENISNSISG